MKMFLSAESPSQPHAFTKRIRFSLQQFRGTSLWRVSSRGTPSARARRSRGIAVAVRANLCHPRALFERDSFPFNGRPGRQGLSRTCNYAQESGDEMRRARRINASSRAHTGWSLAADEVNSPKTLLHTSRCPQSRLCHANARLALPARYAMTPHISPLNCTLVFVGARARATHR